MDGSGDTFSAAINGGSAGSTDSAPRVKSGGDQPHATCALPLIRQLLGEQGLTLQSCDAFAFAAGPGKFSALRLVCALARSFAYALGKPLLAVPSFAALAQANFGGQASAPKGSEVTTVKCALPAQQEHVYMARCQRDNGQWGGQPGGQWRGGWRVQRTAVHHCDSAPAYPRIRHACGAGYATYPQMLGDAAFCDSAPYPHAAAVWELAAAMLAANETSDPLNCQPLYVRHQVAQTIHQRQCKQKPSKN